MATLIPNNIVFGIQEPKPIKGLPEGRARLRLSDEDFAQVFVKTKEGIRRFLVEKQGGEWVCSHELESRTTIQR